MKILLLGATGFIGQVLFNRLVSKHEIIVGGRSRLPGYPSFREIDFTKEEGDYSFLLKDIDVVINAIGIVRGDFEQVQTKGPIRLFEHCKERGIRILNISAIGAEKKEPPTPFLRTKKVTDEYVIEKAGGKVLYPGVVFGEGGESIRLLAELSSLPVIPILKKEPIPVVHVRQVAALVEEIIEQYEHFPSRIFALAPPETLKDILRVLRGKKGRFISIPSFLPGFFFSVFPKAQIGIFNKNLYALLTQTKASDYEPRFERVLPLLKEQKIPRSEDLLQQVLLLAVSFIWLWSGIISFISWDQSLTLMEAIGIAAKDAPPFIWAGILTDLFLGVAIFFGKYRKRILILQLLCLAVYTLLLSFLAPEFWMEPFGPVAKNIPLAALIFYLYRKEKNL